MTADERSLARLATQVAERLAADGLHIVTVESCTGGLVAKLLTDIAGSSAWFDCGYVTYSNAAKQRDVGVQAQTLLRHGAVSDAVVREMAEGALTRTGADIAVALSGVAGPAGGTARNPVGSVWIAVARRRGEGFDTLALLSRFVGDRDAVRRQAAGTALSRILRSLEQVDDA